MIQKLSTFLILVSLPILASSCASDQVIDRVYEIQLSQGRKVAAYIAQGSATTSDVANVLLYSGKTNVKSTFGNVFRSVRSNSIIIRKLSNDSVLILYDGGRFDTQVFELDGVHFIYRLMSPVDSSDSDLVTAHSIGTSQ